MGILRADRVSGLGGTNAINGSVRFGGDQHLRVATSTEFNLSNSNFTLECWVNFSGFDGTGFDTILMATLDGTAANTIFQFDYKNSTNNLRFIPYVSNSAVVYESSWSPSKDTWYHVAACRSGADLKLFVDGTQIGSTHNIGSTTVDGDNVPLGIGQRRGNLDRGILGYISNLRLVVGTALYTSNFTAPAQRLTNIDNTVLLCCQSPGNVLQEETGKTIESVLDNLKNAPPRATHFAPDVGEDYGITFEDNTKFDTLSYMVPPGGTTTERGRGRGLIMGGGAPAPTSIEYIQIQSAGTGIDFGDLTGTMKWNSGGASSTRGLSIGGNDPVIDTIEYVTIATTSNAIDFGNLTVGRRYPAISGNETRCVSMAGYSSNAPFYYTNIIDYVTIATTGNATDFGDTDEKKTNGGGVNSPTRGIIGGGQADSPYPKVNTLEYITIASTGAAANFGDLTAKRRGLVTASSSIRGIFGGGVSPTAINTIDYVTIATTGDAVDFGDTTAVIKYGGSGVLSSHTRGVLCHSGEPSATNILDYVDIATTGNAQDFGDLLFSRKETCAVCSDCHGGLS